MQYMNLLVLICIEIINSLIAHAFNVLIHLFYDARYLDFEEYLRLRHLVSVFCIFGDLLLNSY